MIHAIGRRKTSIARIYMEPGNGTITVNKKDYTVYFPTGPLQYIIKQAQETVNVKDVYDINVNVEGGGYTGQAEAIRLAIARGLVKVDEANKTLLRAKGLMTRDPRMV